MSNQITFTAIPSANLEPRRAVFLSGTTLTYCATAASPVAGILSEYTESGEAGTVITSGDFVCDCSGSIDAGAPVISTTDGVLVTGASTQTGWFVGRALTAAVSGRVRVSINPWFAPADA